MNRIIEVECVHARVYPGVTDQEALREGAILAITENRVVTLHSSGRAALIDPYDLLDSLVFLVEGAN